MSALSLLAAVATLAAGPSAPSPTKASGSTPDLTLTMRLTEAPLPWDERKHLLLEVGFRNQGRRRRTVVEPHSLGNQGVKGPLFLSLIVSTEDRARIGTAPMYAPVRRFGLADVDPGSEVVDSGGDGFWLGRCVHGDGRGVAVVLEYAFGPGSVDPHLMSIEESMEGFSLARALRRKDVFHGVLRTAPMVLPCSRLDVNAAIPVRFEQG